MDYCLNILQKFLLVTLFCDLCLSQVATDKLCTDNYNRDACQQIERDPDIACQFVASKVDCIIDADQGLPVLTTLTAEEALLGAPLVSSQAVVVAEILKENNPYETAVIVRASFSGSFENLKGLRYCHPGYSHDELVTKYVLEELDRKVINLSCSSNDTLVEKKFNALASFFGNSCRPGSWTEDDKLDAKLKNQYSSLCSSCGSSGCNTKYQVPFNETLSCLKDNGGDIALTTLSYSNLFFSIGTNVENFKYLCLNGSVSPASNPCTWTKQINTVVVTSSESAVTMKNYIQNKLPSYINTDFSLASASSNVLEASLALLLGLGKADRINLLNPTPLSNFVSERRHIPTVNESSACNITVRWSTTKELEQNKCQWLQQAALNVGLNPVISCVKSQDEDTISNLDNIKNDNADIAFVDANFGYIAGKKNLINVAYPETDSRQLSRIVIVVRNETQNITALKDLKGKRICLPEYGGKEWLAFIDVLRDNKVLENSCDYGKLLSNFVGNSCAPGANAKDIDIDNTDKDKFCENCLPLSNMGPAKYCNADSGNKYFDSFGALTCLEDDNGDYAVIALNDLPLSYRQNVETHIHFRVISKNGSLAEYSGFEVDENAPLAIITAGEVIIKNGSSKYDNVVLLLRDIEKEFGQKLEKTFKVFERFNHTADLLFPDSTPGLTFEGSTNKYIDNFKSLLTKSETCSAKDNDKNSSYNILPAFFTILIMTSLASLY